MKCLYNFQPIRITVCYWQEKNLKKGSFNIDKFPTIFDSAELNNTRPRPTIFGCPCEEYPGLLKVNTFIIKCLAVNH